MQEVWEHKVFQEMIKEFKDGKGFLDGISIFSKEFCNLKEGDFVPKEDQDKILGKEDDLLKLLA